MTLGGTLCKDQSAIKPIHIGSRQKAIKESIVNSSLNRHLGKFKKISKIAILKRQWVSETHVHLAIWKMKKKNVSALDLLISWFPYADLFC